MFPCDGLYRAYFSSTPIFFGCGYNKLGAQSGRRYISYVKKAIEFSKVEKPDKDFFLTRESKRPELPPYRETRKASKHLKYWPEI